jgi:hypothetical protein
MGETITIRTGAATEVIKVIEAGPQGPAGPAGTGLETLTTQGDLLYRGASTGQRLAIGTSGQVLKVANGIPAWGNESGAVTSVNGETGTVILDGSDLDTSGNDDLAAFVTYEFADGNGTYYPLPDSTLNNKRVYRNTTGHHVFFENLRWHITDGSPITANIIDSSDDDNAAWPWLSAWDGSIEKAKLSTIVGRARSTFLFVGDSVPSTSVSGLGTAATSDSTAFAAASHTHGNLTNAGAIGTTANLPLKTGTNGVVEAGAFGTAAGSFCAGDDARLSDARTPSSTLAHKASHATGGTDALAPSDIGAQSIFLTEDLGTVTANVTLTAARAKIYTVNTTTSGLRILLPTTDVLAGDVVTIRFTSVTGQSLTPVRGSTSGFFTNDILTGQQVTFIAASTSSTSWTETLVDRHPATSSLVFSSDNTFPVRISGRTQEASVTSAGRDLLDDADAAAQRVTMGAAASGSITTSGLTQSTARILGRTTASTGAVEEIQIGSGLSLSAGELSATGSGGISAVGASTADVLSVSGSDLVADDPNADRIVFWDDSEGKWRYLEAGSGLTISGTTMTATASGGISAVDATTADVLSVSGSNLVADDGGTINGFNPAVVWDDAAGKLVYANPMTRSGAFAIGLQPTTTALGTNAISIQPARGLGAERLASAVNTIAIGESARASAEGANAIGYRPNATNFYATALGQECAASGEDSIAIGGFSAQATANNAVAIGRQTTANLRAMFSTRAFNSVYWGGQTTNATATILNLDATATNRMTIAANTALAVDILLVARRSDVADKWLVARRFLGIRRDGSNNTSLIGTVQTLGTDQSAGSPTWTFALTADDTNEALQLEVTGAASETVQWRATAFYRVV